MGASDTTTRARRAPTKQVLVAVAVALALLGVLAYAMAPFRAAGGLKCGAALLGSDAKERRHVGLVAGREAHYCDAEGKSRLIIAGFATVFTVALGVSAVVLPVGLIEDIVSRRQ